VEVLVEDNGKGLSAKEKVDIFKPFHTTKAHGMGMGLCVSRSIIELYMGQLHVVDRVGGGTIFRFELPVYLQ
jgi:signal transduction histidine kinase